MRMGGLATAGVSLLLALVGVRASLAATVPDGFVDRPLVKGLRLPTAVSWAPDGRMFVAEKAGRVRVVTAAGKLVQRPLLDISEHVNTVIDQGILGLAVDHDFATNGFLYLLYVYDSPEGDPRGARTARLSRVVVRKGNTVAEPRSPETVVLGRVTTAPCPAPSNTVDCIPSGWSHTIGTVRSGRDGTLWVGAGDAGAPFNAYDERSYSGKILHVDRSGRGLPGHPFCPADQDLSHVCTKVHAKGFRNPFRFTLRPRGGLVVGDVGFESRDEIDFVTAGRSYGWPCYEGAVRHPRFRSDARCAGPLGEYGKEGTTAASVGPVHDYRVRKGAAVIGGPQYTATRFPAAYRGDVFFGDFIRRVLRRLDLGGGRVTAIRDFATGWSGVDLQVAPSGDLAYVDLGAGTVRAISWSPGESLRLPRRAFVVDTDGIATVPARCVTDRRCHGVLTLSRRLASHRVVLGRARFSVAARHKSTIRVELSTAASDALRRTGRLACRAGVSTRVAGHRQVVHRRAVLRTG
jgi:glucose/arabinose dehydrogenase